MRAFIIALVLMFTQVSVASEVPAYLKDAVITVTLKDGKVYTFSANEYMVAKRGQSDARMVEAQRLADSGEAAMSNAARIVSETDKPWRVQLLAGMGSDGHSVEHVTNQVTVTERKAFVYGAQLARKVYKDYSVSGTVLSNQTYTLGIGLDFK